MIDIPVVVVTPY